MRAILVVLFMGLSPYLAYAEQTEAQAQVVITHENTDNEISTDDGEQSAEEEADPTNEAASESSANLDGPANAGGSDAVTGEDHHNPNCPHEDIEKCDLLAQQSMDKSTVGMNVAAWTGIFLTIGGLILLYRTMGYTAAAAEYARRAAVAAEETIGATKESAKTQSRAYLSVTGGQYGIWESVIDIHIDIKNSGQTPSKVGFVKWIFRYPKRNAVNGFDYVEVIGGGTAIAPVAMGVSNPINSRFGEPNDLPGDFFYSAQRAMSFTVICELTWPDVFGDSQTERFRLLSERDLDYRPDTKRGDHDIRGRLALETKAPDTADQQDDAVPFRRLGALAT